MLFDMNLLTGYQIQYKEIVNAAPAYLQAIETKQLVPD